MVLGDSHGRSLWVWLVRLLNGGWCQTASAAPPAASSLRLICTPAVRVTCAALPPAAAGAFDTTIDDPLKFWADASWDGSSASGQPAGPGGGGDLHVRLRWLPTVPPIAAAIRQMWVAQARRPAVARWLVA